MKICIIVFLLIILVLNLLFAFSLAKISSMCSRVEEEQEKEYLERKAK